MVPCFSVTLFAFPCDQEQSAADEDQAPYDAAELGFEQAQLTFHVLEWNMVVSNSMTWYTDAMEIEAARREYASATAAARRARTILSRWNRLPPNLYLSYFKGALRCVTLCYSVPRRETVLLFEKTLANPRKI